MLIIQIKRGSEDIIVYMIKNWVAISRSGWYPHVKIIIIVGKTEDSNAIKNFVSVFTLNANRREALKVEIVKMKYMGIVFDVLILMLNSIIRKWVIRVRTLSELLSESIMDLFFKMMWWDIDSFWEAAIKDVWVRATFVFHVGACVVIIKFKTGIIILR